jgi:D-aminopeptidase
MKDSFHVTGALAIGSLIVVVGAHRQPRSRDLGIAPASTRPVALNAITDVDGVRVGHRPRSRRRSRAHRRHADRAARRNLFQDKVAGAVFVGNAFGKLAGSTQVNELGTIETPIVLTNTLSVGTAMDAVVRYTIAQPGNEQVRSVNALVGETNDGGSTTSAACTSRASTCSRRSEREERRGRRRHVGAGTGTICYGWKGGIGTVRRAKASAATTPSACWRKPTSAAT